MLADYNAADDPDTIPKVLTEGWLEARVRRSKRRIQPAARRARRG